MVPESTGLSSSHASSPICHPTWSPTSRAGISSRRGPSATVESAEVRVTEREGDGVTDYAKLGQESWGIKPSIAAAAWRINSVPAAVHLQTPPAASKPRVVRRARLCQLLDLRPERLAWAWAAVEYFPC